GGVASHDVVQARERIEFRFASEHEGLTALRQLYLSTQHILAEGDASGAPGNRVIEDGLGLADGVDLYPAKCAGQKDIHVRGGDVELHGLVGSKQLELGDASSCDRLAVATAGPPEVVEDPLKPQFRLRVVASPGFTRPQGPRVSGHSRIQGVGDHAVLPKEIDLRQEWGEGH